MLTQDLGHEVCVKSIGKHGTAGKEKSWFPISPLKAAKGKESVIP